MIIDINPIYALQAGSLALLFLSGRGFYYCYSCKASTAAFRLGRRYVVHGIVRSQTLWTMASMGKLVNFKIGSAEICSFLFIM